jgi:hypothetical protein
MTKPRGHWKDKQNQKEFFDKLAIKWNIQTSEDWNKVTNDMVLKEGGKFIHKYYNDSLKHGTNVSCVLHSDIFDKHYKLSIPHINGNHTSPYQVPKHRHSSMT